MGRQLLGTTTFPLSQRKGNLPFEHELFETALCCEGLLLTVTSYSWASANYKWSSDLKKLQVTARVVPMMATLNLMYPERLSSLVDEMAQNQYKAVPAF